MAAHSDVAGGGGHWVGIVSAGFLVVLVSYSGPLLIYLQAAHAMGADAAEFSSWVFAISVTAGLASILLSWLTRAPVATAWSAPGTVLLISLGTGMPFAEVVGAFLVAAVAILVLGVSGLFDRLVAAIPRAVADGMMAGILFGFGLHAMGGLGQAPFTVALLIAAYFALSALSPRYAMLGLLVLGLILAWHVYGTRLDSVGIDLAHPVLTRPEFSLGACLSLALPLVITTLTGQFLPGLTILRASGYAVAARPIIVVCALASLVAALFGGITVALASITLALCAGPEAHPDPGRRWLAGVAAGVFFVLGGVFAGTVGGLLALLPVEIIALLAGLALLGAILRSMSDMVASGPDAQAGLVAFLVTTTGASIQGIGSAFWGVVVGIGAVAVTRAVKAARARAAAPRGERG